MKYIEISRKLIQNNLVPAQIDGVSFFARPKLGSQVPFVNEKFLRNITKHFIAPHIDYAITVWGNAPKYLTNTIKSSMNKAVKIMCFEDLRS